MGRRLASEQREQGYEHEVEGQRIGHYHSTADWGAGGAWGAGGFGGGGCGKGTMGKSYGGGKGGGCSSNWGGCGVWNPMFNPMTLGSTGAKVV
eukprot:Skav209344  [mRNA]  locus=scaffold241:541378:543703:- [translate_table: standard]